MKNFSKKLKKKNSDNKKLSIMFKVAFLAFLFINLGFSAYTDKLQIESMATIEGRIYDLVRIQKVSISEVGGGSSSAYYGHKDAEMSATAYVENNSYIIYKVDLINESPYNAYVTNADIVNFTNESGVTSENHSYEIIDLKESETIIPMHGTYSFYIKVTGTGIINMKFNFQYSLYKYFDLTINVNPNDADITMTTTEGTYTGTGTVKHRVKEGSTVTYSGSKKYYYTKEDTYVMPYGDQTIDLTLDPDPHRTITFNTTPADASVVVTANGEVILPTEPSSKSFSIPIGTNISYTVTSEEYYDKSGTHSVSADDTIDVALEEFPWITGTISNTDRTVATVKTDTNYHSGYYLIEAWGGRGGSYTSDPGADPGYVYGVVYIPYNAQIFATVGGNGDKGASIAGGANGGGKSGPGDSYEASSGGGYTAFAVGTTGISESTINSGNVKIIAAGSGGESGKGGMLGTYGTGKGGAGGKINGTNTTTSLGTVFRGDDGAYVSRKGNGLGGYTTGGGTNDGEGASGQLLLGGDAKHRGAGGGAGYYGGGGGSGYLTPLSGADYGPGGGGGGSSFIANGVTFQGLSSSVTSKLKGTNPSSTGGAVIITFIGKNM